MPKRSCPQYTHIINEIIYVAPITRTGTVPLRWLDKPAKEYIVQHYDDGAIELRPIGNWSYVVKATDDDVLYLKETEAGADTVEVRHKANGTIWLRPPSAAKQHGEIFDAHIKWRTNPGRSDDYCKLYEYVQRFKDEVILDHETIGYPKHHWPRKMRFIHDDWDRTHEGLREIPRELRRQAEREELGEERWKEIEREEAERREYARAYREKRKLIDAGLLPPTPRLLKERAKRQAASERQQSTAQA